MQELIQNIAAKAGITEEQAKVAIEETRNFVKSKAPMASGIIDQFFSGSGFDPSSMLKSASNAQSDWMDKAKDAAQDAREKAQEFTQDAIDKSSEFAKEANKQMHEWAQKAGGWSEEAMNKIKDMFGNKGEEKPKA